MTIVDATAFSFIVYRYFEAITRKKASFDRYRKIELTLAAHLPPSDDDRGDDDFCAHSEKRADDGE